MRVKLNPNLGTWALVFSSVGAAVYGNMDVAVYLVLLAVLSEITEIKMRG